MKAALLEYLRLGFGSLFTRYESAWLDTVVEHCAPQAELILSDVLTRHPDAGVADDERFARLLDTDACVGAAVLYRLSHALFRVEPKHSALPYLAQFMRARTGMEIYYSAEIGPRFRIMHGLGLVLGPRHRIGSDFTVYQGVTLGQRRNHCSEESLTIGDRCTFFAGAAALGALRIGNDVKLAANAVLLADAEASGTYAGGPAVKVR